MKIDNKWIKKHTPCGEGIAWAKEHNIIGQDRVPFIKALMVADKLGWANWLIVRTMTYKQYVSYAVYSAEQVIDIYEKKYPENKRPRQAIEAAKKCIKNPTAENKKAANAATNAAYAAANAAYAAANAAYAAANAAYVATNATNAAYAAAYAAANAADAAYAATNAAYAAAYVAAEAADAAYAAANAADAAMKTKILLYGLKLITTPAGEKG